MSATRSGRYELAVVGGGPAGYSAAIRAARHGAKTVLFEKQALGGTCLNRGCIPAKTLLRTAELIHGMRSLAARGVSVNDPGFSVSMPDIARHKNSTVKRLTDGVARLLRDSGVDVFNAAAAIGKNKTVALDSGDSFAVDKVIFAGGSTVSRPPIPGAEGEGIATSDDIFDLTRLPAHLAIIGGGVIGVELATAFKHLGSNVTIVEYADRLLPLFDEEVSRHIEKCLVNTGVTVHTGVAVDEILRRGQSFAIAANGKKQPLATADMVLLSTGRIPDLSGIGDSGVAIEKGRVVVDDRMRTSADWIWAPGDVNATMMLAHAAFHMADIAVDDALNVGTRKSAVPNTPIPSCVYTRPEAGCVGITEAAARERGNCTVGKFRFSANGRALASGEGDGFVKVLADGKTGEILGMHAVGPCAAEFVNEAALSMAMEITVDEVARVVHGHPTFSEAFMEAAADCIGMCVHAPRRR